MNNMLICKKKLYSYFIVTQLNIFEGIKWRWLHNAILFCFMWHKSPKFILRCMAHIIYIYIYIYYSCIWNISSWTCLFFIPRGYTGISRSYVNFNHNTITNLLFRPVPIRKQLLKPQAYRLSNTPPIKYYNSNKTILYPIIGWKK